MFPEGRTLQTLSGQVAQTRLCHPSQSPGSSAARLLLGAFFVHFQSHSRLSKTALFKSDDDNAHLESVIVALLSCV